MITPFGKRVRKLRVMRDTSLRAMAKSMKCSPTYLSNVETGKHHPSESFIDRIADYFKLDHYQRTALHNEAIQFVKIDVSGMSLLSKEIVSLFAARFGALSTADKQRILRILRV